MTTEPSVVVHADKQALADGAAARLLLTLVDAQERHTGPVHLVLTGGSMGSAILASLGELPDGSALAWERIHLWWGDERYLPAGDPERNQTQNGEALLDSLPIPPANIHAVAGPDASSSAEESAAAYAEQLASECVTGFGGETAPAFDVVLLGVGPDAHIASLFPHHPVLAATGTTSAVHDSPKPPPDRVTMTFSTLGRGQRVWFLVAGADKADAVARSLGGAPREDAPAGSVHGTVETLWLLDADAASELDPAATTLA